MRRARAGPTRRRGGRVEGLSADQERHARAVGKRIGQLILASGVPSLAAFETAAVKAGQEFIRRADLYKIVSGERAPTTKALIRIADVLGVEVFQLLVVPERSPRERFIDRLRRAPPGTIARLSETIDRERLPLG